MSTEGYYIFTNEQQKGPLSLEQVAEMLTKREIALDTPYTQSGMSEPLPLIKNRLLIERYLPKMLPENNVTPNASILVCIDGSSKEILYPDTSFMEMSIPGTIAQSLSDLLGNRGKNASVSLKHSNEATHRVIPPRPIIESASSLQAETSAILEQAGILLDEKWITIYEPHFFGQYSRSPNGRYILAWSSETYAINQIWLYKRSKYLLIKGSKIVAQGSLENPNDGKVADNGNFILNDWLYSPTDPSQAKCEGVFYAFAGSGEVLISQRFAGNLDTNGLSAEGQYAVCQICGAELVIFDLGRSGVLTQFSPEHINFKMAGVAGYGFDAANRILSIFFIDGLMHRYSFDGKFLDSDAWKVQRLNYASGYQLLAFAEQDLLATHGCTVAAHSDVIHVLNLALTKNVSVITQAKIHRRLGEIYAKCGDSTKAILHLQKAVNLQPNIGVKKLLSSLTK